MRFFGKVGYADSTETSPGVWEDDITEVDCYGDVIRNTKQSDVGDQLNNDIRVGNDISIVADDDATQNFMNIVYVEWMGELWTITSVEVRPPRLILSLGEVYNGPTPGPPDPP
jgi:hypothetical protein